MAHLKIQFEMARTTGIPEDVVVNTFHFSTSSTPLTTADRDACIARVESFYKTTVTGLSWGPHDFLSPVLTGAYTVKAYRMEDPEPRPPIHTVTGTMTVGATPPLPSEVALCVSLAGDIPAGVDPKNYRGRIYLGPFSANGASEATVVSGDGRPHANLRSTLAGAAKALMDQDGTAPVGNQWCVFSRDLGALVPIRRVWVDNSWDTQRRRGTKPTARSQYLHI